MRAPHYDLNDGATSTCCHRGLCGLVHFYDVTEEYDASLIYYYGEDAYFLQCEAGGTLAEAQKNWEKTVDSFFDRRRMSEHSA